MCCDYIPNSVSSFYALASSNLMKKNSEMTVTCQVKFQLIQEFNWDFEELEKIGLRKR
jgi:hypothetical protein